MITTAVILARGLGSRMRAAGASLDAAAAKVAATGVKALIPDAAGRPFLDHVLQDLADAGLTRVVLVIGPEHTDLRHYYSTLKTARLSITFAEQARPLGTADAVAAAEEAVAGQPFLVINSDNRYPVAALSGLAALDGPGLVGFTRSGLLRGNIPAERIARFAVMEASAGNQLPTTRPADDGTAGGAGTAAEGCGSSVVSGAAPPIRSGPFGPPPPSSLRLLTRIIEKPDAATLAALGGNPLMSMNCWAFTSGIFAACRAVKPSPRGELELPDAVSLQIAGGVRFAIVASDEPVLDLSSRDDVAAVRAALGQRELHL